MYAPRRNWDSPNPFLASECSPLPRNRGEGAHLPAGGGLGGVPIPTRGIHCGTLYMYVLCEHLTIIIQTKRKRHVYDLICAVCRQFCTNKKNIVALFAILSYSEEQFNFCGLLYDLQKLVMTHALI